MRTVSRTVVTPAGLAIMLAAACGSTGERLILEPPPRGQGIQFAMTTSLQPGVEAEHCLFVKGPVEQVFVNRDEDCILDSDPAVANEMSAAATCSFYATDAAVECATEIAACEII